MPVVYIIFLTSSSEQRLVRVLVGILPRSERESGVLGLVKLPAELVRRVSNCFATSPSKETQYRPTGVTRRDFIHEARARS